MTFFNDTSIQQLFLSLYQALPRFYLGHGKEKKKSFIREDLHVTLKVSRNFVIKNTKLSLEEHLLALSTIQMSE